MEIRENQRISKREFKTHHSITIIGKKGSGKSVVFDTILHYLGKKTYIILIDVKDEYTHFPTWNPESLKENSGIYRITELHYQGQVISDKKILAEFFSKILFDRENCMLAIDEVSKASIKHYDLSEKQPNLDKVITMGRSKNVGFICATQRPQQISTEILSQSNHKLVGYMDSQHDIDLVCKYISISPQEFKEYIKRFEWFHYWDNRFEEDKTYIKYCRRLYSRDLYKSLRYYEQIFGKS